MEHKLTAPYETWRAQLVDSRHGTARILLRVRRIAVIGIKPEHVGGPAFDVPARLQRAGYTIVPVPVYYPLITSILGEPVHRSLATIDGPIDMVVLFRRSADVPGHLDEILAARPSVVWMQSGIRHDAVAETLARAGLQVVQDRCAKVELEHMPTL
ncbi:MAG: CoA-binding protein [Gemmatimonas sp.]|jgi:predicted CoA-binding protein|uniref:CoA-binding protein n=1 Tax=Gemmatimonas sp. TaxID=1962908 RepID=UPI00391F30D7|nr:CoA-binding protein [Gemmatimonadota bacterium]